MNTDNAALPQRRQWIPEWLRNPWGVIAAIASVYVLAYIAWTYFHWGGEENIALISDVGILPLTLFGAAASWRIAATPSLDSRLRCAWLIFGFGIFALFLGDLIWFQYEIVLQVAPFPSLADLFYLLFYPLMLWGLLTIAGRGAVQNTTDRLRFVVDLSIVMVAAWMVVWYFIISPTADANASDFISQVIAAAYPIGDLVVMGGVLSLLWRGQRTDAATRSALLLLLSGLALFVTADLIYAYTSILGTYASGGWVDTGWVIAYLLFAFAALRQTYTPQSADSGRRNERLLDRLSTLLPFAAIGFGYGLMILIASGGFTAGPRLQGLFVGAGLLTAFVLGRQMIALRENARLNAELRALSSDLERRVVQRTLQLQDTQQALFVSQKLASVGTLAAGVVHEVSNPLNTILTAAESLEMKIGGGIAADELNKTLTLYLPIITRAGQQAARIVQALRTYSRGSAPELALQDLLEVLQDALLLMGYQLKSWGNVTLATDFDSSAPKVLCDRNQIAQVLINLLNNARDAMPQGGVITLRTRRTAAGAVIEVADQGIGIPPESLGKVFDPFYTTKEIGKGSGLGLSIVAGIVRAHNGTVEAHSAGPGCCTSFTITMPIASAA